MCGHFAVVTTLLLSSARHDHSHDHYHVDVDGLLLWACAASNSCGGHCGVTVVLARIGMDMDMDMVIDGHVDVDTDMAREVLEATATDARTACAARR
jgi:hypothetical protein